MRELPTGTVAFLMTDIEGSTRLVAALGDAYPTLLDRHFALLDAAVNGNGGQVVSSEGDALFAVFRAARQAAAAGLDAQRAFSSEAWPAGAQLKVRMGIHVGEAMLGGRDYTGLDVHRASRICGAAWGGEILVSEAARSLVVDGLPEGASLRDLGMHALRDLPAPEHLFQLCGPGMASTFPPPRSANTERPGNLPAPVTRFVGRARELAEIRDLLAAQRLVTLTGPGGTGKTRLAMEVARSVAGQFPGGAWFVALESVTDPTLVVATIAQTIGVPEQAGRSTQELIAEALKDERSLLVLDNLEQVIESAQDIAALLAAVPGTTILASSRQPLGIGAEHVYPVPALALPDEPGTPTAADLAGADAVELFVERARAVRPAFGLTDENAAAVAAICRRLDGLPLAIELAAARVNLLSPAQILTRLDHRLTLVTSARRDLPERQRTLRGAIDWSYDLLGNLERAVFRRFAVFAGGGLLAMVLPIIDPDGGLDDPLDQLAALVDRSLIRSVDEVDESRYLMLDTIREYAGEQLVAAGEDVDMRGRHAREYARLAEDSREVLRSPDRIVLLDRLDRELHNFRAATKWAITSGDPDLGFSVVVPLRDFWRTRNHIDEARHLLTKLLAASEQHPGDPSLHANAMDAAAELASWQADYQAARDLSDRAIDEFKQLGDRIGVAHALGSSAWGSIVGEPTVAEERFTKALGIGRETGDSQIMAAALQGKSLALLALGRLDEAREASVEAIREGERLGDPFTNAFNHMTLGMITLRSGHQADAARLFGDTLRQALAMNSRIVVALSLEAFGTVAYVRRDFSAAAKLATVADRIRREIGGGPTMALVGIPSPVEKARAALSPEDADLAIAEGTRMSVDDAVATALALEEASQQAR